MVVVSNGINTQQFKPDPAAGDALRKEWGVSVEAPLVGVVARLDPMKDHQSFLRAASVAALRKIGAGAIDFGG